MAMSWPSMDANHKPLQRFWPFTRDSLHIGVSSQANRTSFCLGSTRVVTPSRRAAMTCKGKQQRFFSLCNRKRKRVSAENHSLHIPSSREADVFFHAGTKVIWPWTSHRSLLFDTTNFENLDTTPTLAKKVEWLPIHLDSYDSSRTRFWHLSHEGQLSGHGHICLLWPETLSRLTQAVSNENPMKVQ